MSSPSQNHLTSATLPFFYQVNTKCWHWQALITSPHSHHLASQASFRTTTIKSSQSFSQTKQKYVPITQFLHAVTAVLNTHSTISDVLRPLSRSQRTPDTHSSHRWPSQHFPIFDSAYPSIALYYPTLTTLLRYHAALHASNYYVPVSSTVLLFFSALVWYWEPSFKRDSPSSFLLSPYLCILSSKSLRMCLLMVVFTTP